MDILATLKSKIDSLDDGDHTSGLRAVLLHIETAFSHLSRGQKQGDSAAFTDAVYRSNQAFEGSIKEAYRVLTSKDPSNKRPYDIEKYLEGNDVLRPRVLSQFTTYRTEWRNPSTHDYQLDFDDSEAFLAIMNVTTFACLLIDQIAERQSYEASKAKTDSRREGIQQRLSGTEGDLLEFISSLLIEFAIQTGKHNAGASRMNELQLLGSLSGFVTSAAPDIDVVTEQRVNPDYRERGDMLASRGGNQVLLELKCGAMSRNQRQSGLLQLEHYLQIGNIGQGLLFLFEQGCTEYEREEHHYKAGKKIFVLLPKKQKD
jgi:hypothetical protein